MSSDVRTTHAETHLIDAVGLSCALFTLFAWSMAPLLVKYFTGHIDLWTSNGWRYATAALLWLPVLLWLISRGRVDRTIWRNALVPAAFNTLGQVCFVAAFYQTGAAMVTFGLRIHIVFVALGAALLFPAERALVRSPIFMIAAGGVLLGTAMVAAFHPEFHGGDHAAATLRGIVLSIVAGFGFAGYALAVRRFMRSYHAITSFAVISQYTASAMVALMLFASPDHGAGALTLGPWLFVALIVSAIIPIALAHVAYYTSINRLGVALTSGLVQLQPFCVAAVSVPLLGEKLLLPQWIGGAIAVGGAVAMLRAQQLVSRAARARAAAVGAPLPEHDFENLPVDADVAAATTEPEPATCALRD